MAVPPVTRNSTVLLPKWISSVESASWIRYPICHSDGVGTDNAAVHLHFIVDATGTFAPNHPLQQSPLATRRSRVEIPGQSAVEVTSDTQVNRRVRKLCKISNPCHGRCLLERVVDAEVDFMSTPALPAPRPCAVEAGRCPYGPRSKREARCSRTSLVNTQSGAAPGQRVRQASDECRRRAWQAKLLLLCGMMRPSTDRAVASALSVAHFTATGAAAGMVPVSGTPIGPTGI